MHVLCQNSRHRRRRPRRMLQWNWLRAGCLPLPGASNQKKYCCCQCVSSVRRRYQTTGGGKRTRRPSMMEVVASRDSVRWYSCFEQPAGYRESDDILAIASAYRECCTMWGSEGRCLVAESLSGRCILNEGVSRDTHLLPGRGDGTILTMVGGTSN